MTGNIQVVLEGKGPVTLRQNDHIATGGEGSIFRISDYVVKIYSDPQKMKKGKMHEKIKLLTALKHPYIVAPSGLAVAPGSGDPVGYYMPFAEGHPLSRVFTNEFYQRENFTSAHASTLVDRMRQTFLFAHQHGAVMVDPNELNWLTQFQKKRDPEPRVVDVDSWAIGQWPAVVIMPSIRDWHSKKFDALSDWFAWAIVTFQVYTGIHPYKGTLDGFERSDLEGRMKANASVFTSGVRLNRAVRDFSCIPGPLLGWYEATLQKGERTEPPSPFDTGIAAPRPLLVTRVTTTGKAGLLVFEKLLGYANDPVTRVFYCGVARLGSGGLVDLRTKRPMGSMDASDGELIKVGSGWLMGSIENQEAKFTHIHENGLQPESLAFRIRARRLVSFEDRLFAVTENGLMEVRTNIFGEKCIASPGQTWGILVNSTKWFDGFGVIDAMGAKFIIAPFGSDAVAQVRIRELDGLQVVSGKAGNRFISLIAIDKQGVYRKIEFAFDRDYRTYKVWTGTTDGPELNMAILPKGVCATIQQDGELTIFVPANGNVTKVEDKFIATDMVLSNWKDTVLYLQNGEVWSLRMK